MLVSAVFPCTSAGGAPRGSPAWPWQPLQVVVQLAPWQSAHVTAAGCSVVAGGPTAWQDRHGDGFWAAASPCADGAAQPAGCFAAASVCCWPSTCLPPGTIAPDESTVSG